MRLIGMVIMAAFPTDLSRIGRLKILDQQSSLNLFVASAFQTGSSVTDMGAALVSKLQTTQSRGASRSETLKNRFSDAKSSKVKLAPASINSWAGKLRVRTHALITATLLTVFWG
jgi:hypothetical protein